MSMWTQCGPLCEAVCVVKSEMSNLVIVHARRLSHKFISMFTGKGENTSADLGSDSSTANTNDIADANA